MITSKQLEKALRDKFRFNYNGQIAIEDLYDIGPIQLNTIYVKLSKNKKDTEVDSLINSNVDKTLELKLAIVKHVFDVKIEEAQKVKLAGAKRLRKQKILEIKEKKSDDALEDKSLEELDALLLEDEDGLSVDDASDTENA